MYSRIARSVVLAILGATLCSICVAQQAAKPNILVISGDDIGTTNVSAYSDGLMGYTTPNIDRIASEGVRFLHYYGEQSSDELLRDRQRAVRISRGKLTTRDLVYGRESGVSYRPAWHPYRADEDRLFQRADGDEPARSVDRWAAEESRLCDRPVRPRSVPPSFNPANILEDTLRDVKARDKLERAFPVLREPGER